jgi:hypothetical protein
MLVDEDLSKCRVLTNAEMLALMHRALLANSWGLPPFDSGSGDRRQRDAAVRMFAAEVVAQLLSYNTRFIQAPAVASKEAVAGARRVLGGA